MLYEILYSRIRYWLLILLIIILNILFIVYFTPPRGEEIVCPSILSFSNNSLNENLDEDYVALTVVVGAAFALLSVWMLLEYFIVMWPHFVLPKIMYTFLGDLDEYRLLAPFSK